MTGFPPRPRAAVSTATLVVLAGSVGPFASGAGAQEATWSVEEPGGPTHLLEFTASEGTWMSVDVSPDGRSLVFDLLGHLYEMPVEGGDARRLTRGRSWNLAPRYSPDGSRIAFDSDRSGSHDVWLMDRETGELTRLSRSDGNVHRPAWSTDGRHVVASAPEGLVAYGLAGDAATLVEGRSGAATARPDGTGFFFEFRARSLYPFEFNPYVIVPGGYRIERWDGGTGETTVHVERPGGAFNPAVSPDGTRLAYLHRDLEETVLVVQDLETRRERVILRGLDLDRQEGGGFAGPYPNMSWHPDGRHIYLSFGGGIHSVDVESGETSRIPFQAPVRRKMTRTLRFTHEVPDGRVRTRMARWARRTPEGVVFEALGDLWLQDGSGARKLTSTPAHETSPLWDPGSGTLYYASWTDADHGAVHALRPGEETRRLTRIPSQYGALALSRDGSRLAYVRGTGALQRGLWLSNQTRFELVVRERGGEERIVTGVEGRPLQYANIAAKIPPHVLFGPDGETLYFTEFVRDTLTLKRIDADGNGERTLYRFPHAVDAVLSPDLKWIALREYHRSFLTPFLDRGRPRTVSAYDGVGTTLRVDPEDGGYLAWSRDGRTLSWTRAAAFYEKDVERILAEDERGGLTGAERAAPAEAWRGERVPGSTARRTDLSVGFPVAAPDGVVALTGVRVVTMNADRDVLEGATVLVRGGRIEAVGTDVEVPPDARAFDLEGHTVIPGLVDAHAHPHIEHSPLHVIEQRPPYLAGALAYGVTTMFEVYGNEYRDGWLSDMLRAGKLTGPRLFTTGSVIYGRRTGRVRMFRPVETLADAREQLRWNLDHGALAVKDYAQATRKRRHLTAVAARELGLNVLSESSGDPQMNLTQILDGVTGIEHSMGLAAFRDDVVRFWEASGAGMSPTLVVAYGGPMGEGWFHQKEKLWEDEKLTRFILPRHLMRLRRRPHLWPEDYWAREMASSLRKLYESGTSLQLGAHGQMLGLATHWELEIFQDGGFPPEQILELATIGGATHLGLSGSIGSVEPGKLADLVVLRKNPLEDIANARSIRYVLKHGTVYDGADASRVHPDPRPAGEMYFRRPGGEGR